MKYLIIISLLLSACLKVKPKNQDSEKQENLNNQYALEEYYIEGDEVIDSEDHPLLRQNFKKIIWLPNATLTTNGFKLKLQFEEMILSENNILQTLPENLKAPMNIRGRSGGDIEIRGHRAVGHLKIMMRGENGGDGSNALEYAHPAADGVAGRDVCFDHSLSMNGELRVINCRQKKKELPTAGTDAANGLHGRAGQRGASGGSAGRLLVDIKNNAEFVSEIISEPGLGGVGGLGALGQKGGQGGRSGVSFFSFCHADKFKNPHLENINKYYELYNNSQHFVNCPAPRHGKNGTDGLPGSVGAPGDKGAELKQCIEKENSELICY